MTERTTVRLPDELMRRAKRKAAAEGRTLTALIEDALLRVVDEKPAAAPRVMPPVSTATGWLKPGVCDLRELQELEDIEYMERLRRL